MNLTFLLTYTYDKVMEINLALTKVYKKINKKIFLMIIFIQ